MTMVQANKAIKWEQAESNAGRKGGNEERSCLYALVARYIATDARSERSRGHVPDVQPSDGSDMNRGISKEMTIRTARKSMKQGGTWSEAKGVMERRLKQMPHRTLAADSWLH